MEINEMVAKFVCTAAILAVAGSVQAAAFSVNSLDLGAVEPGAPGFFGVNVTTSGDRFFRSNLTSASDKGPVQSATSPNRIFDSYAGFDGGAPTSMDANGNPTGPFAGPTVSETSADLLDGYDTNTGFGSVIPIGFTLAHFNAAGNAFGGGAFESAPRAATNALALSSPAIPDIVNSFFVARLTVQRGALLTGGVIRALISTEGLPSDGGVVVTLALNAGVPVLVGTSNNTGLPVALSQGYTFDSILSAQPNGLGNQQGVAGAFGNGDTYDLYINGAVPTPGAIALLGLAGLGATRRRRA
jgi:MYXO-CTERM domain-containing protein